MTKLLIGIIVISFVIFLLYVLVKSSQDNNQAVSLDLTADKPIVKE